MSGEDAPRPCPEDLIVPEIKTNKQTMRNLVDQNGLSSSFFNLYRFGWFQLLLDNAHFFVLPKVVFVFSGPHLLGFEVSELKVLLIDNMLATVLCLEIIEHGMDGASLCV